LFSVNKVVHVKKINIFPILLIWKVNLRLLIFMKKKNILKLVCMFC
jgi:hypothetical protein